MRIGEADKTAVSNYRRSNRTLYWEKPRGEAKPLNSEPFVSQLQKEAIRRQKEAEPQSGHVEPLFLPFKSGAISKLKKAHNILEKLSDKESQQDEPRYYN